ncbi:MAG: hypothetical protein WD847_08995 [Pirellulales bacterium]
MATDIERLIQEVQALPLEDRTRVRKALEDESNPLQPQSQLASEAELQKRLVDAGLLKEVKRPLRDAGAFKSRKLVSIEGKPLSETIIEERR